MSPGGEGVGAWNRVIHVGGSRWSSDPDDALTGALIAAGTGQEVLQVLVITRREGEEVVIGDPTTPLGVVRIAAIKGDRVRIAFEFPREIDVHRREVAQQIIDGEGSGPSPVVGKIRPAANDGP